MLSMKLTSWSTLMMAGSFELNAAQRASTMSSGLSEAETTASLGCIDSTISISFLDSVIWKLMLAFWFMPKISGGSSSGRFWLR